MNVKFVIITSTGGSVFKSLSKDSQMFKAIKCVVSDRDCEAIRYAKNVNLSCEVLKSETGKEFSNKLLDKFKHNEDVIFISFYTKLLSSDFLSHFNNKVINFHPSILPAFPGLKGFNDSVSAGSKFIGSTVHFVDNTVDGGRPIIQAARPFNPNLSIAENRHLIYLQQCKMLKQVMKWFIEDRVRIIERQVSIEFASYDDSEFSPNLDI